MTDRRLQNLRRRVNRARDFPVNTCPASRHVHMIADFLSRGERYAMIEEEPEHVAESLLSVLESLWKARTEIRKLKQKLGVDLDAERERELRKIEKIMRERGVA